MAPLLQRVFADYVRRRDEQKQKHGETVVVLTAGIFEDPDDVRDALIEISNHVPLVVEVVVAICYGLFCLIDGGQHCVAEKGVFVMVVVVVVVVVVVGSVPCRCHFEVVVVTALCSVCVSPGAGPKRQGVRGDLHTGW